MSGTTQGGRKAAITIEQRYGKQWRQTIGRKGGIISRGGGFTYDTELAKRAGAKGGKASRRGKAQILAERELLEDL